MTGSRRAAMAKARQSRRPSRLGTPAGAATKPDYPVEPDAGFPGLLDRVWRRATTATGLPAALDTLLTLGGHVPAEVQLRALRTEQAVALEVLFGVSTDRPRPERHPELPGEPPAFLGELGLTTGGRVLLRVPAQGPLAGEADLVGGVLRVPWSARAVAEYRDAVRRAAESRARSVADCRRWLTSAGGDGRHELVERLKEAALRTAPFVLYQEGRQYTNFRDRNTLTGKTLWPGHPDCALSGLQGVPLELWSDNDVVLVVCLTLLIRSAGYARIEEANGTQLTVEHVARLLDRVRCNYNAVPGGRRVPPAASTEIAELDRLAEALRLRRKEIGPRAQLYREIHGALLHKIERVAGPPGDGVRRREERLCARLSRRLPVAGATLAELGANLSASPGWLAEPHGDFPTGLESLVYETVRAATAAFDADFAMSRGIRSLPRLIKALREADWAEITRWELPEYFCCVVPAPEARWHFGGSTAHMADMAWAMSSRMQYNSWHFIAGNLPRVPVVLARDFFVPPTIPDVAYHSDLHHHGHVAAGVRFSIRSPQRVEVLGRPFDGFVDLRLLRCAGRPFDEQDLLAAHRSSAFLARATEAAAELAAGGADLEVTSFDSAWHWTTITNGPVPTVPGESR
ncbi:MAG TPA: hypothetical protein VGX25_14205 [Actinophytocola sp.]|uniref:hypothetical protein n=1 Tax=Actinophytocola sp. TaxID=1872138 RepID=UPI002DDD9E1E|nr:hypothetical protein [Actinophytocola sp.]HEV2780539.1 hypothetical protein [Actinophytocola sp.]